LITSALLLMMQRQATAAAMAMHANAAKAPTIGAVRLRSGNDVAVGVTGDALAAVTLNWSEYEPTPVELDVNTLPGSQEQHTGFANKIGSVITLLHVWLHVTLTDKGDASVNTDEFMHNKSKHISHGCVNDAAFDVLRL
jgi:hypothetical protein